jgi:NAD-dependent SIR2 family protein deacetylase
VVPLLKQGVNESRQGQAEVGSEPRFESRFAPQGGSGFLHIRAENEVGIIGFVNLLRLDQSGAVKLEDKISEAARAIKGAEALLITAGAGMGVDSGLPDFRGARGFWEAYPAIAKLGFSFEEMADPSWFTKSPDLAWAFYGHRLNLYRRTVPHQGFQQLLELGSRMSQGYFVFTSNVDGQFQKAGFDPDRMVECHGSIHHFQCTRPCTRRIWDASQEVVKVDEEVFRALEPLPRCRFCQALARPNIMMFGDGGWIGDRSRAQQTLLNAWLQGLKKSAARLVVIELGAGSAIPTVRHTSEDVLEEVTGTLIRINPREEAVPAGQIGLALGAAEGIRRICKNV